MHLKLARDGKSAHRAEKEILRVLSEGLCDSIVQDIGEVG